MGKGVAVLVVLPSETFDVVLTVDNRALLGSLSLMSEHVGLQVFEGPAALGMRTPPLGIIVNTTNRRTMARAAAVGGRGRGSSVVRGLIGGVGRQRGL